MAKILSCNRPLWPFSARQTRFQEVVSCYFHGNSTFVPLFFHVFPRVFLNLDSKAFHGIEVISILYRCYRLWRWEIYKDPKGVMQDVLR